MQNGTLAIQQKQLFVLIHALALFEIVHQAIIHRHSHISKKKLIQSIHVLLIYLKHVLQYVFGQYFGN